MIMIFTNDSVYYREFEQTMDALQSDIDSLENEKTNLQAKLNNMTKKQMYDSLTKGVSGIGSTVGKKMMLEICIISSQGYAKLLYAEYLDEQCCGPAFTLRIHEKDLLISSALGLSFYQ